MSPPVHFPPVSAPSRTPLTFRYEAFRAVASGILETASTTFLVLIAVRWFEAGALAKGLVASGAGLGYVISPVMVSRVEAARVPVARAASRFALAAAVALGLSALIPGQFVFVASSLVAIALAGAMTPLLTQIYQDNYPDASRGRFFSRTVMIRIASAVVFAAGAGYLLSINIGVLPDPARRVRRCARVLGLVSVAHPVDAAAPLGWPASAPRLPVRPRRSRVPHHADLVDVHGFRQPDDAAAARRVSRQPAIRSWRSGPT